MLRVTAEFPVFFRYRVKFFEDPGAIKPKPSEDVALVQPGFQYTPTPTVCNEPVPGIVF